MLILLYTYCILKRALGYRPYTTCTPRNVSRNAKKKEFFNDVEENIQHRGYSDFEEFRKAIGLLNGQIPLRVAPLVMKAVKLPKSVPT